MSNAQSTVSGVEAGAVGAATWTRRSVNDHQETRPSDEVTIPSLEPRRRHPSAHRHAKRPPSREACSWNLPFDENSDVDVAIASKPLFEKARKAIAEGRIELEISASPQRIGPIKGDNARTLSDLDLQRFRERTREIVGTAPGRTDARDVNILLFSSPDAVEKLIGEASKEARRVAIPLKVEQKQ